MIPAELISRTQWILWRYEDKSGYPKPAKVPYTVKGHRARGALTDNCVSYEEAVAAWADRPDLFSGLGFVFAKGVCGFDLDGHIKDPKPDDTLEKIISENRLSDFALTAVREANTAVEISISGTGLHGVCYGTVPEGYNYKFEDGTGVEAYSDGRYFTVADRFNDKPVAPMPEFLRYKPGANREKAEREAAVLAESGYSEKEAYERCLERVMQMQDSISGEGGHDAIFAVCCEIARWNITGEDAWKIASAFNDDKADPPWDDKDLRRKIKEGRKRVTNDGEIGAQLQGAGASVDFDEISPGTIATKSPSPSPAIELPPDMDRCAFKSIIGGHILNTDEFTEANRHARLLDLYVKYGNIIGRRAYMQIGNRRNYPNLFGMIVGGTALGRKGETASTSLDLLALVAPEWQSADVMSSAGSGEGITGRLQNIEPPAPGPRMELLPEHTSTKPREIIVAADKRLLIEAEEAVSILIAAAREGSNCSAVFRQGFDGSPLSRMVAKEVIVATEYHLSFIGHITPKELNERLQLAELYNGFANRIMWCLTHRDKIINLFRMTVEEREEIDAAKRSYDDAYSYGLIQSLKWLDNRLIERDTRDQSDDGPCGLPSPTATPGIEFRLDQGAMDAMAAFNDEFNLYLETCALDNLITRAITIVGRIALINAVLAQSDFITAEHVEMAIAQWRYYQTSAEMIFGGLGRIHPKLVEWIRKKGGVVSPRDISRLGPAAYRPVDARDKAIAELIAAKIGFWGEWLTTRPGQPVQQFRLH